MMNHARTPHDGGPPPAAHHERPRSPPGSGRPTQWGLVNGADELVHLRPREKKMGFFCPFDVFSLLKSMVPMDSIYFCGNSHMVKLLHCLVASPKQNRFFQELAASRALLGIRIITVMFFFKWNRPIPSISIRGTVHQLQRHVCNRLLFVDLKCSDSNGLKHDPNLTRQHLLTCWDNGFGPRPAINQGEAAIPKRDIWHCSGDHQITVISVIPECGKNSFCQHVLHVQQRSWFRKTQLVDDWASSMSPIGSTAFALIDDPCGVFVAEIDALS